MPETLTQTVKLLAGNFRFPVQMTMVDGRIEFQFRYNKVLMDEIKSMAGAKWHGRDDKPRKVWSVLDCERNRFQLAWLQGENPYTWFEQPVKTNEYAPRIDTFTGKSVFHMDHQKDLTDCGLTYHFQIWGAEPGLGKSLSAIELIERADVDGEVWWVGPRAAIKAVERELRKWGCTETIELMTYEGFVKRVKNWSPGTQPPRILILDESQRIKTSSTHRSQAAFHVATAMRNAYGYDCYVIEMTGTPSPKSPVDWWHQAEVSCPGFLREGTPQSFHRRLAFFEQVTTLDGASFWKQTGWRDDERKCDLCGHLEEHETHDEIKSVVMGLNYHRYKPSVNEVALLYERLKGLVVIKRKKDCLDLPEKHFRTIRCAPNPSTLRAAQTLLRTAPNTITGITLLRELSDGFQYGEKKVGTMTCPRCEGNGEVSEWFDANDPDRVFSQLDYLDPDLVSILEKRVIECPTCDGSKEIDKYVREASMVPCPKEDALRDLLEENEDIGRIVIFAGFTGAIDRCVQIAQHEKWCIIRVDGRGWSAMLPDGTPIKRDALDLWSDLSDTEETRRVAFIAHPGSGGVGLTLTEASVAVFYSNDFNPEYRAQAMDRIHRPGMDYSRGATIVDVVHLPSDERVLEILSDNRRLELMSMGELSNFLEVTGGSYDY